MTSESPNYTRVLRLQFETGALFPSGDAMSVPLARLLAATNDVMLLQKLAIVTRDHREAAGEFEKTTLNGELGYFVRMLFGHLYEAGIAFRFLEATERERIDRIIRGDVAAKKCFEEIRRIYNDPAETGFYKGILGCIRNLAGFHYKDKTFEDGLEGLKADTSELLISEHIGFTRYVLADEIVTRMVLECMGGEAQFRDTIRSAFELADELAIAVTHLLKDRLEVERVPTTEQVGEVPIPEEIARTRSKTR